MKACLVLLLALSAGALVSARVFQEDGVSGRSLSQVQLGSSAFCPAGCDRPNGGCVQDNTMAGLRCQRCLGNLLVNSANGNCTCPAGKYADVKASGATNVCLDCPKGWFCPGGDYSESASAPLSPLKYPCPINMTTVGRRSVTNRACVQEPGFYYVPAPDANSNPSAVVCPINQYSPGLKKQRACVPCPTGFITDPAAVNELRKSPSQCLVPAGYYLKAPGQVAPCPMGEYKEGLSTGANCTKCAFGVTTFGEGSTSKLNCSVLLPGYYAAQMDATNTYVLKTTICPQGYYCPGGAPNASFVPTQVTGRRLQQASTDPDKIIPCPNGAWTVEPGASSLEQCLVPPGYFFDLANSTAAQRVVKKCPLGSFRADWLNAADPKAQTCISCGVGVHALQTDLVKVYNVTTDSVTYIFDPITTSSDDCYIEAGQGLYYASVTNTYRAVNCNDDNYGVANRTFGWTPVPCRECPLNMVAIENSTYSESYKYFSNSTYPDQGFTSALACVTIDGYGYNSRIGQACEKGFYNQKNNRNDCTQCSYGLTTTAVGAGVYETDCGIAPGFGFEAGAIRECPIGSYNNNTWTQNRQTPCIRCPVGLTTQSTGSISSDQCNICQTGYGGYQCAQQCGGDVGAANAGTYGNEGRATDDTTNATSACVPCTTQATGYSFSWQFTNDNYSVPAISPVQANASTDCLAKYSQTFDGAWFMPDTRNQSNNLLSYSNIATFGACVTKCDTYTNSEGGACQWVTYDYTTQLCTIRVIVKQVYVGAPVVGFKAVPSGDVGTNAWSTKENKKNKVESLVAQGVSEVDAQALASGQYTFYQDEWGLDIGNWTYTNYAGEIVDRGQKDAPGRDSFTSWQQCLNACDDDYACTAFIIRLTVDVSKRPSTCILVYGRKDVGEFKRTFVRADITRLKDISGNLK